MKLFRSLAALGIVLGATAFAATNAEAALMLRVTVLGGSSVLVTDNDATDENGLTGVIVFDDAIDNWLVNTTTGVSQPILGSATDPHMDLNSLNISSGAGTLILELIDPDFTGAGDQSFTMQIGGTTSGTVTYVAFADGNLIDTLGPFPAGAFSDTGGGSALVGSPYTVVQRVTIVHTASGVTSFDAELLAPEPASLALLGLGLVGVGVGARRRRNAA